MGDEAPAAEAQAARGPTAGMGEASPRGPRAVPSMSIDAFCEDRQTADALQAAAADRRLARARMHVGIGGVAAAIAHCSESPTPDLIVVETTLARAEMLAELEQLADCCDAAAKLVVIGQVNDVALYRELLRRGISDYLLAPVSPAQFIEAVANLYGDAAPNSDGAVIAFIGAKGGVGSSTVCHNVAWAMSEALRSDTVVVDLDFAFGTVGLDFNQDPTLGIAEALQAAEQADALSFDRFLTRCSEHLHILAAPVALDRDYDVAADACQSVLDALRRDFPFVALDLPHAWSPLVKRVLLQADEIVVTAAPDLANLRNAKTLIDLLKATHHGGSQPHLVINMAKTPKRPDIPVKEFAAAVARSPALVIDHDSEVFGIAANNGQMIEEFSRTARAAQQFRMLALALAHRTEPQRSKRPALVASIMERLRLPLLSRRLRRFSTA
jgi:pilus assembly protein CpaE